MKDYTLKISTPDGDAFSGSALSLSVRGTEGELGILAGHAPFVTAVVPCRCRLIEADGTERSFSAAAASPVHGRQSAEVSLLSSRISIRKLNTVFFTNTKDKSGQSEGLLSNTGRPLFSTFSRHSV